MVLPCRAQAWIPSVGYVYIPATARLTIAPERDSAWSSAVSEAFKVEQHS